MKHLQVCLSAREDRECSFDHCGGPVRLVQACYPRERTGNDVLKPPRRCCEARAGLFNCQRKSTKHFSPLWRPFELGASLFMCGKDLITPF